MMEDRDFLIRAIHLAEDGIKEGNGPFGTVIVRCGEIISETTNKVVHSNDPTAHAEVLAIRQASKVLSTHNLSDCILYTSCEPCPMCLGAIYWSGIKTIFFAADRQDAEAAGFSDKFIYEEISLPPEKRHILFKRLSDIDGNEVFRIWDKFENKIPY
jgi:guanine deaminase